MKSVALIAVCAALFSGCTSLPPTPNRTIPDPSDPAAPVTSTARFRPNLVASTKVFLDPSVGQDAQQMGGSMQGMGGMDHSKMQGMEQKQTQVASPSPADGMQGMDHCKMKEMTSSASIETAPSPEKEAIQTEMKKTSDEMKKLSDEMKAKSDSRAQPGSASPTAAVYTCPMHPEVKSDKPGNCPKCGMKLVERETNR